MLKYIHTIIPKIKLYNSDGCRCDDDRRLTSTVVERKERYLQVAEHGVVAEGGEEERRNIDRLGRGR